MIKINAAVRLEADDNWFARMSKEEQKRYVQDHPDSQYAEDYDNAQDAEDEVNGPVDDATDKADRIKWVRKQMAQLSQDIEELKEAGEDYSKERKLRDKYRAELADLQT